MGLRHLPGTIYRKSRTLAGGSGVRARRLVELAAVSRLMAADKLAGRKIVIVFIEELGFIQFLLPIFEELKRRGGKSIAYYLATEYADREGHVGAFAVPPERRFHPRIAPALILADVFLSASVYGKGPAGSFRINVSHNQPTKFEAYPREYLRNYNVHFLTGPLHRQQYEHMFALHGLNMERFRLVDIGYPKSDALIQGRYDRQNVLGELGLDAARKTVLYAPAWDAGGSLRCFGEEVIEQLLDLDNVNVVAKLHPVSHTPRSSSNWQWYTGGVDWTARFRRFEKNPRFRHVTGFQIDPLLVASDVLVTDFSSVALEFIVLDRPVIYLDCPEYFEKTLRLPGYTSDPEYVKNDPRANAGRHTGLVVENVSQLAAATRRSLAQPEENSAKRRELAAMLLYNPGKGATSAARAILEMLEIEM